MVAQSELRHASACLSLLDRAIQARLPSSAVPGSPVCQGCLCAPASRCALRSAGANARHISIPQSDESPRFIGRVFGQRLRVKQHLHCDDPSFCKKLPATPTGVGAAHACDMAGCIRLKLPA